MTAMEVIAAHRDGCSPSWSSTGRTARSRTSGENLFVVLLIVDPSSQELGPPAIPGQFIGVEGSNPFARSSFPRENNRLVASLLLIQTDMIAACAGRAWAWHGLQLGAVSGWSFA